MADRPPLVIASSGRNADWLHAARPVSMVQDVLIGQLGRYPTDEEVKAWMLRNPVPGHPAPSTPRPPGTKVLEILGADKAGRLVVLADEFAVAQGVRYVRVWEREARKFGPVEYADAVLARGPWKESRPKPTAAMQAEWSESKPGGTSGGTEDRLPE